MVSNTEAWCAFAVLTTARKAASVSAPHTQRKPLVTLRKITLGRRWRSEMLLVYGTSRRVMNTNRCARLASMRLRSLRPGSPIGVAAMIRSRRRSRSW
jgi:hypothetical protein